MQEGKPDSNIQAGVILEGINSSLSYLLSLGFLQSIGRWTLFKTLAQAFSTCMVSLYNSS